MKILAHVTEVTVGDPRVPALWWLCMFLVTFNHFAMTSLVGPVVLDTGTSVNNYQAVLVLRALITAVAVPTAMDLCDMFGLRKVTSVALLLMILGSFLGAIGQTVFALFVGLSLILGLASAPLTSIPWARMEGLAPGRIRDVALMLLGLAMAASGAIAPTFAGIIADSFGWRWSFVPQMLLAGAMLLLVRHVPPTPTKPRPPIDWLGAVMALVGMALILGGLTLADEYGWWDAAKQYMLLGTWPWPFQLSIAPVLILMGAILIGFWLFERRSRFGRSKISPFRMGTLRRRPFFATVVTAALLNVAMGGLMFALFVYVPLAFSLKSLATTIAILPLTGATLVASLLMPLLSRALGPKRLIQLGLLTAGIGALLLLVVIDPDGTLLSLVPGFILFGLGAGLVYGQTPVLVMVSTASEPNTEATGVSSSMQMLGSSVGTAIIGSLFMVSVSAFLIHGVATDLGTVLTPERRNQMAYELSDKLRTLKREEIRELVSNLPSAVRDSVVARSQDAAAAGMRVTLVAVIVSLLVGLGISVMAPMGHVRTTRLLDDAKDGP